MKWKAYKFQDLPFSPGYMLMTRERIEDSYKVAPTGCWEWTKARTRFGYGKVALKQNGVVRQLIAHRLYYQLVTGEMIPDNMVLGHKCDNPPCINPGHMEVTTQWENNARGVGPTANNIRKTACDNGHEFTLDNTGVYKNGWRYCRTCARARTNRRARERSKEYRARGLNAKGKPMDIRWKRKFGIV